MWQIICTKARKHWAAALAVGSALLGIAPQIIQGLQGLPWYQVVGSESSGKIMFGLAAAGIFFTAIQSLGHSDEGF